MPSVVAMKQHIKANNSATRSVKVLDPIHHRLRVLAAQKRMPLQAFINALLDISIKRKLYDEFLEAAPKAE
jgi:hypothetical protein